MVLEKLILIACILATTGCWRDAEREEHIARMFANIVITAEAQVHPEAPPIEQTARAIKTAAAAGLKLVDYEIER